MVKRIREYVKYTLKELEEYTAIKDSCVKKIRSTMHIGLLPHGLNNLRESILENVAHQKIGFFDNKLEGIILDVKKIKILKKTGTIRSDDPTIHLDIAANCYIFQPQIGAVIRGIVKHISTTGSCVIGVIIYRVFSVSIKLQDHTTRNIQINSEIEFRIKDFNLQCSMPFIEGELIAKEEMLHNDENMIEYENNKDNDTSNENSNQSNPANEYKKELELSFDLSNSAQLQENFKNEITIEETLKIKMEVSDHDMFSDDSNINVSDNFEVTLSQDSNNSSAKNHVDEKDKIKNIIKTKKENLTETTPYKPLKEEVESTQSDSDKQSLKSITKTKRKRTKSNSSSLNNSIENILIKTELQEQSQSNDFEFLSPKQKESLQPNKKKKKSIDNSNSSNFELEIDKILLKDSEIEHKNSISNRSIKIEPEESNIQQNGSCSSLEEDFKSNNSSKLKKVKNKKNRSLDLELNDILSSFETEKSDLEDMSQSKNKVKNKKVKFSNNQLNNKNKKTKEKHKNSLNDSLFEILNNS